MKLVKNGEIVLDGTLNKAQKEKLVFEAYEKHLEVFELIRDYAIDFVDIESSNGDYEKYVSNMRCFYNKYVNKSDSWKEWQEQWVMNREDYDKVWRVIYES